MSVCVCVCVCVYSRWRCVVLSWFSAVVVITFAHCQCAADEVFWCSGGGGQSLWWPFSPAQWPFLYGWLQLALTFDRLEAAKARVCVYVSGFAFNKTKTGARAAAAVEDGFCNETTGTGSFIYFLFVAGYFLLKVQFWNKMLLFCF